MNDANPRGSAAILIMTWAIAGCAIPIVSHVERAPDSSGALRAELDELCNEMERRLVAGDGLAVAQMYADDGVLLSPGGSRVAGRQSIDEYWQSWEGVREWHLETISVEGDGALACQRGTSRIIRIHDGEERVSAVEFMLVWIRDASGEWRISVDAYW